MLKNTLFFTAALSFFAIGCSGDKDATDSGGDTGTVGSDDDDDDDTDPLNEFDDSTLGAGVVCSGTTVDLSFTFLGDAGTGYIDMADTANYGPPYGNWNDTHTLDASGIAGGSTDLSANLTVQADPAAWSDGVSTVFRCDYHFDDIVMTYIARAYDLNGDFADCVAWGDDASGFIADSNPDGDAYTINARPQEADIAGCRTVAAAK